MQAVETTDRSGVLLDHGARRRATVEHFPASVGSKPRQEAAALAARARPLLDDLESRFEVVSKVRRWSRLGHRGTWWVVVLGGLVGVLAQGLGSDRQISILAVPLMALVAWNIAVLVLSTVLRLLPVSEAPSTLGTLLPRPINLVRWWQQRTARSLERQVKTTPLRSQESASGEPVDEPSPADVKNLLAGALETFVPSWLAAQRPLLMARLRRSLHLGSMAVVAGTVLGMYGRGLVREYRVAWESTFLTGEQVDALLGRILAPASGLLGLEIPSVATYPWPETFDAAPFIHLWAATALLFVIVPRTLFWLLESLNVARLERRLAIDVPSVYRRRLRSAGLTVSHQLDVWPYSHQPSSRAVEHSQRLLLDAFGRKCRIRLAPVMAYGDEVSTALADEEDGGPRQGEAAADDGEPVQSKDGGGTRPMPRGRCVVVWFNLAQTPEMEVHGDLLTRLREALAPGQSMAVWVDTGPYQRRLGDDPARLESKRGAWERLLEDLALPALFLDLEAPTDEDLMGFDDVVWPPGSFDGRRGGGK